MFENVAYHLTDIHFHMPSEHLLSGKQYPLEFHLVHMNDAGENLVVGCLFTITEEENRFQKRIIRWTGKTARTNNGLIRQSFTRGASTLPLCRLVNNTAN